ncbi:MAG: hypothetical protein U5R48_09015 [Gammaproteobacteria bacterium]|nr:hypothetical protein [Gammaproteobacteria bacterium]
MLFVIACVTLPALRGYPAQAAALRQQGRVPDCRRHAGGHDPGAHRRRRPGARRTSCARRRRGGRECAAFIGSRSPMDFNGMVRHYYLREAPHLADLRVTLAATPAASTPVPRRWLLPACDRELERHSLGGSNANIELVEVPPGPPVLSTLVAGGLRRR